LIQAEGIEGQHIIQPLQTIPSKVKRVDSWYNKAQVISALIQAEGLEGQHIIQPIIPMPFPLPVHCIKQANVSDDMPLSTCNCHKVASNIHLISTSKTDKVKLGLEQNCWMSSSDHRLQGTNWNFCIVIMTAEIPMYLAVSRMVFLLTIFCAGGLCCDCMGCTSLK
jgi:hypothetical protein